MKSLAIAYGMGEGPKVASKFINEFEKDGYKLAELNQADIIIAHSGGGYVLPRDVTADLIMLINLPYWPHKRLRQAIKEKIVAEHKSASTFLKSIFNAYYMVRDRQYFDRIRHEYFAGHYPRFETKMVLVRNKDDSFLDPAKAKQLALEHNWSLIEMPGGHDDLWINPEAYVNLVNRLIKDL